MFPSDRGGKKSQGKARGGKKEKRSSKTVVGKRKVEGYTTTLPPQLPTTTKGGRGNLAAGPKEGGGGEGTEASVVAAETRNLSSFEDGKRTVAEEVPNFPPSVKNPYTSLQSSVFSRDFLIFLLCYFAAFRFVYQYVAIFLTCLRSSSSSRLPRRRRRPRRRRGMPRRRRWRGRSRGGRWRRRRRTPQPRRPWSSMLARCKLEIDWRHRRQWGERVLAGG